MSIERWTDEELDQLAIAVATLANLESEANQTKLSECINQVIKQQENASLSQQKILIMMEQMGTQQQKIVEAQSMLTQSQSNFAEMISQVVLAQAQMTEIVANLKENLNSAQAAVERLDRLMDYLIRRDGERERENLRDDESENH